MLPSRSRGALPDVPPRGFRGRVVGFHQRAGPSMARVRWDCLRERWLKPAGRMVGREARRLRFALRRTACLQRNGDPSRAIQNPWANYPALSTTTPFGVIGSKGSLPPPVR